MIKKTLRIHYIQHVHFEGLGYISAWLQQEGHTITATKLFQPAYSFPSLNDFDALIVMGGPMGVYDDHLYNWLQPEKIFIEDCVQVGKKVLGICLGAQLLAVCLGAKVHTAKNKEIGWFPVTAANECKNVSWFYNLFKEHPAVFHWHGDKFEIPYGALNLLSSVANNNQAFWYNPNVIGLQFHLESTGESLQLMIKEGAAELKQGDFIQDAESILSGANNVPANNKLMDGILKNWLY